MSESARALLLEASAAGIQFAALQDHREACGYALGVQYPGGRAQEEFEERIRAAKNSLLLDLLAIDSCPQARAVVGESRAGRMELA